MSDDTDKKIDWQHGNFISSLLERYRQRGPNPLSTALLLGAGTYGLGRLAWGPLVSTYRSLKRPVTSRAYSGVAADLYDEETVDLKHNNRARRLVPLIAGLGTTGAALFLLADPRKKAWGMFDWTATRAAAPATKEGGASSTRNMPLYRGEDLSAPSDNLEKTAALDSYYQALDWSKPLDIGGADRLLRPGNGFDSDTDFARLTGRAIVNNAVPGPIPGTTTLGGIFDSARSKIENKLSLSGIADTAIKTTVANGAARLFTSALDAVCGLKPATQRAIIDTGTWAGAITSILS